MHDAANSGVADGDLTTTGLGLQQQVQLDQAVLTSPAIVNGRAFVVDQMGTAYCVDLASGTIEWKTPLPAKNSKQKIGGNTSSPAVISGQVIYGTGCGRVISLDHQSGQKLWSFDCGWPIVSSVTVQNKRVYVPAVDSSLHCLSIEENGKRLWHWDHYALGQRWTDAYDADADGDRFDVPHFGGAPVCVVGKTIYAPLGYDLVCLSDENRFAEEIWRRNQPVTKFDFPVGCSSDGKYVYCSWPKSDGMGAILKHEKQTGQTLSTAKNQWAVLNPPALASKECVLVNRHAFGTVKLDLSEQKGIREWQGFGIATESVHPAIAAISVAGDLAVTTTLDGELLVFEHKTKASVEEFTARKPQFRFELTSKSMITSAPAIDEGRIVFGADDGCLYVLGPGGERKPRGVSLTKGRELPPHDAKREWTSAFGGGKNQSNVADKTVRPPFELSWALKSFSLQKHPAVTSHRELIYSSFSGLVVCRDQQTGKIHWRRKLPGQAWSRATLSCGDGKVFVPRVSSPRYAMIVDQPDALYCLDQRTGNLLWSQPIGRGDWLRASPVYLEDEVGRGFVAYGSKFETPRAAKFLAGPATKWRVNKDRLSQNGRAWANPDFDDSDWTESRIANDGNVFAWQEKFAKESNESTYYLRTEFELPRRPGSNKQLAALLGPADEVIIYIDGRVAYKSENWDSEKTEVAEKYTGVAAELKPLDFALDSSTSPAVHKLAIGIRRAKVKSNVSSSTSVFPPRLIVYDTRQVIGPTVVAWHADTGKEVWHHTFASNGNYIEGPAGCTDGELFYFTGGGAGSEGKGMTAAFKPANGKVVWSTDKAFSSRTGTPAIAFDKLLLSGAVTRPLAALELRNGQVVWENDTVTELTMVHAPSVIGDIFTVNTKYVGGAKCWNVATGEPCEVDGVQKDVGGAGHTCGTIVMLSSGYAIAATNKGIYVTDVTTGKTVHKTPGFASQTCPHPIFAGRHMFYSPQNSGMMFRFAPRDLTRD